MNVNFRDCYVFRDYLHAAAPARTIHIVAPPAILTHARGTGLDLDNDEPFRIPVLRQRIRRDTYGRLLTFVIRLL